MQLLAVEHIFQDPSRPVREQGIVARGIRIGDGAWIGAGAIVLDGVTVGEGAVVGAGAVVTRDIPPYAVAVGVPARVVRQREMPPAPPESSLSSPECPPRLWR